MPSLRNVTAARPAEIATRDGLSYSLWLPDTKRPIAGGVVILHGAGSCKESHHDFARALLPGGIASIAFDLRGHGQSSGPLDERVLEDIAGMAMLLRARIGEPDAPVALRGSSMGGYLAILATALVDARAVVAICPASADGLRRGLAARAFDFDADVAALDAFLSAHDLRSAVRTVEVPVLLLHADGDERVPVEHSRELATELRSPQSRLITVPGGHHRSVQHDPELQAVSLRFLQRQLAPRAY